jgi:threonine synthase
VKAETVATAIKIGNPASYERGVHAIMETNGVVLSVADEELLEAKAAIDASGVGCEPASAVTLAGLRRLIDRGQVKSSDRVVAVLTGHILKDPGLLLRYHQELDPPPPGANRPLVIDPDLREVERALRT